MSKSLIVVGVMALGAAGAVAPLASNPGQADSSRAIFERRILPILKSPDPSSCSECHLSGVDLKAYIRPTEAETFVSLRDAGLIDLKSPRESHLLELIRKSTPKTPLIQQKTRDAELTAFSSWIEAAAKDERLAKAPALPSVKAGPAVPDEVIRHTRMDRVVESFRRNVWSQQGRCMGCHTPGTPEFEKNKKEHGEKIAWFVPESAEATMQRVIERKLINVEKPDQSLLLLKPLNTVPHGGGVKFLWGDAGHKMFLAWLEDYAASVKGRYRKTADLPAPAKEALIFTQSILNINKTPDAWGDKLLRVDIYPWDGARNGWASKPVATGDRGVWAQGHSTNVLVYLTVPAGGREEVETAKSPKLAPGRYLLKYYCDTKGKLGENWRTPTNLPEFYQGQQEITSDWRTGWGAMTKVDVELKR